MKTQAVIVRLGEELHAAGIGKLLKDLSAVAGLFIATSKLEKYALVVLDYFNIRKYFRGIAGADASGIHAGKAELVSKIITFYKVDRGNTTVMVGDKKMDIDAANDCGYGTAGEIKKACRTYMAANVEELGNLLLNSHL